MGEESLGVGNWLGDIPWKGEITMMSRSLWDLEQEQNGVALVDRTYRVHKPNGEITEVNRFDFNLADKSQYIQCSDTSWGRVSNLTIVD